ncbi:MAG: ECF transporter S component [Erysipelotrichales bacterium]
MNLLDSISKSTTHKMVFTSIMACLAFILNMFEIPYLVAFLRLDISEVITIFVTITLGLKYGLCISFIKAFLFMVFGANGSEIVGVTVLLLSSSFIATCSHFLYQRMKLIPSMLLTSVIFACTMTFFNYIVVVPLYMGKPFSELNNSAEYFFSTITLYLPFNLVKMLLVSAIVVFLVKTFKIEKRAIK